MEPAVGSVVVQPRERKGDLQDGPAVWTKCNGWEGEKKEARRFGVGQEKKMKRPNSDRWAGKRKWKGCRLAAHQSQAKLQSNGNNAIFFLNLYFVCIYVGVEN